MLNDTPKKGPPPPPRTTKSAELSNQSATVPAIAPPVATPPPVAQTAKPPKQSHLPPVSHDLSSTDNAASPASELDGNGELGERSLLERLAWRETPSWLVSMIVHLAIILLLAIVPLSERIGNAINLLSSDSFSEGTEDLSSYELSPMESDSEMEIPNVEELSKIEIEEIDVPSVVPTVDLSSAEVSIKSGLIGRSGLMKETLLKAYGGTKGTEDAVAAGLDWLARHQRSNGSWSLVGPYKGGATTENESAATAMAMLAFLGAGHTHKSDSQYSKNVKNGMSFLLSIQDDEGFFAKKAIGNQRTYSQAQCTIAICELYGLTNDPLLEPVAMRAIRYAQRAQADDGGWRYNPREPGDMSVTGWYVMALMSARMAGLIVDSDKLDRVQNFLNKVQKKRTQTDPDPYGEAYSYMPYSKASPAMTAEGMLCRMYLGWKASDGRIVSGSEYLCENLINRDKDRISYYYWYYATTALHHVGGNYWKQWNESMKAHLPSMQEQSGPNKGSWDASGDPHDGGGGRLYATCFSIFCLETYYRHLPLNQYSAQ